MRPIHLTNAAGRDATVQFGNLPTGAAPPQGIPGKRVHFQRYLAATERCLHDALTATHGDDYHQALIDGDPEVDLERVGRRIGNTQLVYLTSGGEVLYAAPEVIEVLYAPDGSERERRAPSDVPANTNVEEPVRYTGRMFTRADVARRFVFRRTVQLVHADGLTFDYLFEMARELDARDSVVLLGAGPKGAQPLVFQTNGSPYRAFLEGRTRDDSYQLLLHLSNMELKLPEGGGA
ncbi:MAG: hypothetical protein H6726_13180 [Sandaracinaceae bacterium]|nr:hypothetical protein [Sandaracinaceae bacterium]